MVNIISRNIKVRVQTRVGMWEGISRPGNGRDGMGGKDP